MTNICVDNLGYISITISKMSDAQGGGTPLYGVYRCVCGGPRGYDFSAVLVINGVSMLSILIINRVWFLHSSLELGMFGFVFVFC